MAIKFSTNLDKQNDEIQVLKSIRKHHKSLSDKKSKLSLPIPQVISNGVFEMSYGEISGVPVCFYVMKKYQQNLDEFFSQQNNLSTKFVFKTIKKILEALEAVHEAGYVYNDIKLENVMIQKCKDDSESDPKIVLVDYGLAMKYIDDEGNHLPNREMEKFGGNLVFASLDVLKFSQPSRKDDLLMLCYFLIFLLNGGDMPLLWEFMGDYENTSKQ